MLLRGSSWRSKQQVIHRTHKEEDKHSKVCYPPAESTVAALTNNLHCCASSHIAKSQPGLWLLSAGATGVSTNIFSSWQYNRMKSLLRLSSFLARIIPLEEDTATLQSGPFDMTHTNDFPSNRFCNSFHS